MKVVDFLSKTSSRYGLLAAHLDPRTPAEDWAHWGNESKKLELVEEAAACYGRGSFISCLTALGWSHVREISESILYSCEIGRH